MEHNRCFTQEELNKMLVRPVDAAVAAVEAGDVAEAELWIDKMYKAALRCREWPASAALIPAVALALLLVCTAYLVDGSFNPFLYFRF